MVVSQIRYLVFSEQLDNSLGLKGTCIKRLVDEVRAVIPC